MCARFLAALVVTFCLVIVELPYVEAQSTGSIPSLDDEPRWKAPPAESPARSDETVNKPAAQPAKAFEKEELQDRVDAAVDAAIAKQAKAEEEKAVAKPDAATPPVKDLSMKPVWNDGLELKTADDEFRIHVGGRYQFDTSYLNAPVAVQSNIGNPYASGADFRRARIRIDGTLYKSIDFACEYDFVNSSLVRNQPLNATSFGFQEQTVTQPTDLFVQLKDLPRIGNLRIGNQKEPIGFEHLVSSRFQPLMERSYNQDAFYGGTFNGFTPGIQAFKNYGDDDMGLIQMGVFRPVDSVFAFNTGNDDLAFTARLTKLLSYEDEGRYLTHVGGAVRAATAVSNSLSPGARQTFRARDAVRAGVSSDWAVPAGITLFGDDVTFANMELVAVRNQWTLQSEYLFSQITDAQTSLAGPVTGSVNYQGGYIQLFRYLTDDYDRYDKKAGVFGRVKPAQNYAPGSPWRCTGGARQLGVRYNCLDLNDQGLNGGILHNVTLGYNWFLNPNVKLQSNYIFTYRDVADTTAFPGGSGWINGFGARLAIDF